MAKYDSKEKYRLVGAIEEKRVGNKRYNLVAIFMALFFSIGGMLVYLNPSNLGIEIYIIVACVGYWNWALSNN